MLVKIFRSYLNDAVIEEVGNVLLENAAISRLSGVAQEFAIKYKDVEPRMILQFLDNGENPIDLTAPPQGRDFDITCAMAFTATLQNQINSSIKQLTSSYDPRFTTNCVLSLDSEVLYVTEVTHEHPSNLSYLKVERRGNAAPHYVGANIRVVRSTPSVRIFDYKTGKIKITWQQSDTDMPGDYDLEITLSRIEGASLVRWSVYPLSVSVKEDYDLR
jgi:hypothetical protein